MKVRIKTFWLGVIALIGATILFCLPGEEFPQEDWFAEVFLDKWIHVGLFAGLTGLWCLPFIYRISEILKLRNLFMRITIGFVLYGIAIEFIQGNFIPNRSFGVDDMVADAVGCGVGFLFANWQLRKQKV
jgi:VanZ like family